MIGGVSLIVMNLTKQSSKSSTKYQFDTELTLITNEINGMLSNPQKCLTTFTNAIQENANSAPVLDPTPANQISPIGISGIPSTTKRYLVTAGPYGNGAVKILSYGLNINAVPDPILTINFENKAILGGGILSRTIKLYVEKDILGVITNCRSLSSSSVDIWSRGAGTNVYYNGGNVGIGTSTPAAKLEVNGEIRPIGVELGSICSNIGAQAYDQSSGAPVYCNTDVPSHHWNVVGILSLGEGQTWRNTSNALDFDYTNNSGRAIMISVSLGPVTNSILGKLTVTVGGVVTVYLQANITATSGYLSATSIVPKGAIYRVSSEGSLPISTWAELR